jgi:hypothetical protein
MNTIPDMSPERSNTTLLDTGRDYLSQISMMASLKQSPRNNKTFHKRRQTYDQKFISEEDIPLT